MGAPQNFRQRYIAFKTNENLSRGKLEETLNDLGKKLNFSSKPRLIIYDRESNQGIVRCGHLQVEKLKKEIKKPRNPDLQITGVSGTIKKTKQKFTTL